MTGRGSREKGAEFERKIAKAIRGALQLKTVQCFRAPQSGGHRGVSAHAPGDILFAPRIGELMRVSIECKNHKQASLDSLMRQDGHSARDYWWDWLKQVTEAAETAQWTPVLVARVGTRDYAIVEEGGVFGERAGDTTPRIQFYRGQRHWRCINFDIWLYDLRTLATRSGIYAEL